MLTSEGIDRISLDLADAFEKLPTIIKEIRETVADREALCAELAERDQVIKTQDVLIADLRGQITALQDRMHSTVQHNAKLENVILTAGRALASNETFQAAARELAAPTQNPGLNATTLLPQMDAIG